MEGAVRWNEGLGAVAIGVSVAAWFICPGLVLDLGLAWPWYVLLWPLGLWVPAITAMLPGVFQPWSETARLNRRIRQAKREQEMIKLRAAAERAELETARAVNAYIEGA